MSKMFDGIWIKFKDQEPPLYVNLLVDSDEGLLVAQYRGDNEWTEGGIAWVYYWTLAPKPPEFPLGESAMSDTIKSPEELAMEFAAINGQYDSSDVACRYLKNAYLVGHKAGHTAGFESAMKIHDAVREHLEKELFPVVQHEPLLKETKDGLDG